MPNPSATKIARAWVLKTAKDLPADVERYVEEGKESGMDEGQAWAIAWSRYCKYKNPGSEHCKQDPSDYFKGRKAHYLDRYPSLGRPRGWKPSELTECPEEVVEENLKEFTDATKPYAKDTEHALKALGCSHIEFKLHTDNYSDDGSAGYMFEFKLPEGKNGTLYLDFSGDFKDAEVERGEQFDVDDFEEWTENIPCPPTEFSVVKFTDYRSRELLVRGKITLDVVQEAIEKTLS